MKPNLRPLIRSVIKSSVDNTVSTSLPERDTLALQADCRSVNYVTGDSRRTITPSSSPFVNSYYSDAWRVNFPRASARPLRATAHSSVRRNTWNLPCKLRIVAQLSPIRVYCS